MPLTYPAPATVKPAVAATSVYCVGVNIRMPRVGPQTITYYYEAVDALGKVVDQRPVTVPLSQMSIEKPAAFNSVHTVLKTDAYERAPYPVGSVS